MVPSTYTDYRLPIFSFNRLVTAFHEAIQTLRRYRLSLVNTEVVHQLDVLRPSKHMYSSTVDIQNRFRRLCIPKENPSVVIARFGPSKKAGYRTNATCMVLVGVQDVGAAKVQFEIMCG